MPLFFLIASSTGCGSCTISTSWFDTMVTVQTPIGPTTNVNVFLFAYRFFRIVRVTRIIVTKRVVQLLETDIQKQTATLLCMLFGMVFCVTGLTHLFENQRAWWPEGSDPYRT